MLKNMMEGCPPSHIRNNGQVPTISLCFLCKCHIGSDGNLLRISCHFLEDMMEGCLPIHIGNDADMPNISGNFFKHLVDKCLPNLVISLKM